MIKKTLFNIKTKTLYRISRSEKESKAIHEFNFSDLDMYVINSDIAVPYISEHHYSKSCPKKINIAFGFYFERVLVGCIVYSSPVSNFVVGALSDSLDLGINNVYAMSRMFISDKLPYNAESYCFI